MYPICSSLICNTEVILDMIYMRIYLIQDMQDILPSCPEVGHVKHIYLTNFFTNIFLSLPPGHKYQKCGDFFV